jgi:citrate synthase
VTACNAAIGSGRLANAIAAAILTTGAAHAPIAEARRVLETADPRRLQELISAGHKIPGFGNSFFPAGDPAWFPVAALIQSEFPDTHCRIEELAEAVKKARPNAALYSAAACALAAVPPGLEDLFFILPRTPIWAESCLGRQTGLSADFADDRGFLQTKPRVSKVSH